jgi:cytochrome c oxidase subunit 2
MTVVPPAEDSAPDSAHLAARVERRWATISTIIVLLLATAAALIGLQHATMPQGRVETIDAARLHLSGEFVESNLGTAVEPDGSVTVRAIGQQYSFVPDCLLVPTDTPITFRATSPDVVHGFLIVGTNINTMLVPGYVSNITARFSKPGDHLMPCQEFCGVGHEGMWAKVKVIDKAEFTRLGAGKRRVSCAD